jgi:chromosome segregation ATPase
VSIDLNKLEAMKSEANALREEHIKNEAEIARLRSRSKEINGRLESLYVEIQRAVLGDPEDTRDHPAPARPAEPEGKAAGKGAKPGTP